MDRSNGLCSGVLDIDRWYRPQQSIESFLVATLDLILTLTNIYSIQVGLETRGQVTKVRIRVWGLIKSEVCQAVVAKQMEFMVCNWKCGFELLVRWSLSRDLEPSLQIALLRWCCDVLYQMQLCCIKTVLLYCVKYSIKCSCIVSNWIILWGMVAHW